MMKMLPTPNGWSVKGSSNCVPYTVIASSSGCVTRASHIASHQRRKPARSPCSSAGNAASAGDASVNQNSACVSARCSTMLRSASPWFDEHVQVGQAAGHPAPQRGLPHGRAPAHGGHSNRRTQDELRKGIHAA
jgi:hypothetical protein